MKRLLPEPERWSDRAARGRSSAEDVVGLALRRARDVTGDEDVDALDRARGAPVVAPVHVVRPRWVFAVAFIALLVVGRDRRGGERPRAPMGGAARMAPPATAPVEARAPPRRAHAARELEPTPAPPARTAQASPAPATAAETRGGVRARAARRDRRRRAGRPHGRPRRPPSRPTEPPAAVPSPEEVHSGRARLWPARSALRTSHDPAGALSVLDEHARRFPTGALGNEGAAGARGSADRARAIGRGALALLEHLPAAAPGATRAVRLARGGSWPGRGGGGGGGPRPTASSPAMTPMRSASAPSGRAACSLQFGRARAARDDLERYLLAHPEGRFATPARLALERLGAPAPTPP